MKKALLVVRCAVEVILGAFMLAGAVVQLPQLLAPHGNPVDHHIAHLLKQIGGMAMLGFLGFYTLRDGFRVGRQIGSAPSTPNDLK